MTQIAPHCPVCDVAKGADHLPRCPRKGTYLAIDPIPTKGERVSDIDRIRQRLEVAREIPESYNHNDSAARGWVADVTTLLAEVERLRTALAEVMIPIEALTVAGEDAWELAPEVRGELMTARTLGRAALGFTPSA